MPTFREISHRGEDYAFTVVLRDRILRAPLGLALTEEELDAEANDWHLGAFDADSGELLACLVLTPAGAGTVKMRQVAVVESHRGRGIGRALVRFAEGFARERGIESVMLHARGTVVPFYEALGYAIEGAPFTEVTLPHRRMRKRL